MPLAAAVALQLRSLADSLDREPTAEVPSALVYFGCKYRTGGKDEFLAIARLFPRPFEKAYTSTELEITYEMPAIRVKAAIERDKVCRIVEPAKPAVFECEPLLSEAEESAL